MDSAPDSQRDPSVVFVFTDFENMGQFVTSDPNIPIQLGVANLDIQDFWFAVYPKDIISISNFAFLFGDTAQISSTDIVPKIEACIPETRPMILIGHDVANELRVLQYLDFDLPKPVVAIIGTTAIASRVFFSLLR